MDARIEGKVNMPRIVKLRDRLRDASCHLAERSAPATVKEESGTRPTLKGGARWRDRVPETGMNRWEQLHDSSMPQAR